MTELIKCECGCKTKPKIGWVVVESWVIAYLVICEKCGKKTNQYNSRAEAIEAWNKTKLNKK